MEDYLAHEKDLRLISGLKVGKTLNVSTKSITRHNGWLTPISRYSYSESRYRTFDYVIGVLNNALSYIDMNNEKGLLDMFDVALAAAKTLSQTYNTNELDKTFDNMQARSFMLRSRSNACVSRIEHEIKHPEHADPHDQEWLVVDDEDKASVDSVVDAVGEQAETIPSANEVSEPVSLMEITLVLDPIDATAEPQNDTAPPPSRNDPETSETNNTEIIQMMNEVVQLLESVWRPEDLVVDLDASETPIVTVSDVTIPPEVSTPETSAPETNAPETSATETTTPETTTPETTTPETTTPETTTPETTTPETTTPETTTPETTTPETIPPETIPPETIPPETIPPETIPPEPPVVPDIIVTPPLVDYATTTSSSSSSTSLEIPVRFVSSYPVDKIKQDTIYTCSPRGPTGDLKNVCTPNLCDAQILSQCGNLDSMFSCTGCVSDHTIQNCTGYHPSFTGDIGLPTKGDIITLNMCDDEFMREASKRFLRKKETDVGELLARWLKTIFEDDIS